MVHWRKPSKKKGEKAMSEKAKNTMAQIEDGLKTGKIGEFELGLITAILLGIEVQKPCQQ